MYNTQYRQEFTVEELNNEIWLDVQGFEGIYQVSNLGRVKALPKVVLYNDGRKRHYLEKVLNVYVNTRGYMYVDLYKDKVKKHYLVHRLVADAFLDNKQNLPQVNHIDEDKFNNRASNLEYCTAEYNCNYGTRNARWKKTRKLHHGY